MMGQPLDPAVGKPRVRAPRLSYFTIVSGLGWCLDFAIFNVLVGRGEPGFLANCISATTAVTFVFVFARRWIFRMHAGSLASAVLKYALWNIIAIAAASQMIRLLGAELASLDTGEIARLVQSVAPIRMSGAQIAYNLAKILVTPLTMYMNFLVMGYIVERQISFI